MLFRLGKFVSNPQLSPSFKGLLEVHYIFSSEFDMCCCFFSFTEVLSFPFVKLRTTFSSFYQINLFKRIFCFKGESNFSEKREKILLSKIQCRCQIESFPANFRAIYPNQTQMYLNQLNQLNLQSHFVNLRGECLKDETLSFYLVKIINAWPILYFSNC